MRTFLGSQKNAGNYVVWKKIINHTKLIGASLKWCIKDGRKFRFWIDIWAYMMHRFSFVEDNNLQYINWDAKVHNFIN